VSEDALSDCHVELAVKHPKSKRPVIDQRDISIGEPRQLELALSRFQQSSVDINAEVVPGLKVSREMDAMRLACRITLKLPSQQTRMLAGSTRALAGGRLSARSR